MDFTITENQIKKSFKIKELKEMIINLLSFEISQEEKTKLFNLINERISYIQNYYKKTNKEKSKKNFRYTITYNKDEQILLEEDLEKLKSFSKNNQYKLKDLIKIKSLSKDTLKSEELEQKQVQEEQNQEKLQLIKDTLLIFRNIANNINQISKDINEKRLMNNFFSNEITKEEKQKILSSIQEIEKEFTKFIQNNI